MKMKVVIISQHIFPMQTPRAHRTTELIIELAKRGYDVTVYAVLGKYDYTETSWGILINIGNICREIGNLCPIIIKINPNPKEKTTSPK